MNTPLSSPSPSLSRSSTPSGLGKVPGCVCILSEIRTQLYLDDDQARFQCLAYARNRNSASYGRCTDSSKNFSIIHPILFKKGIDILLSKDLVLSADHFGHVVRMLFCKTHGESKPFWKYFELIKPHWTGDGNAEEKELLDAIRLAFRLSDSAQPGPATEIPGSSLSRPRSSSSSESPASATGPPSPVTTQSTPTPTPDSIDGQYAQILRSQGSGPRSSTTRTLFASSEFHRHTRNRSASSQISYNAQNPQVPGHKQSHFPSQSNNLPQSPSNYNRPSLSQCQTSGARPKSAVPAPGFLSELPLREGLCTTAPREHAGRKSNHPFRFVGGSSQETAATRGRSPTQTSTEELDSSTFCSSPSGTSFDFGCAIPKLQLTHSSPREAAPNGSRPSLPAAILNNSDTTAVQRLGTHSNVSRNGIPASQSSPPSIPASFSATDWNNNHWDNFLGPTTSGVNRLRLNAIPQRQGSKDDTFLNQTASDIAAARPSIFNRSTECNVSTPELIDPTESIKRPWLPCIVDCDIRKAIKDGVTNEGHVYILKAPKYFQTNFPNEPPLLKIGMATDVSVRVRSLKKSCGLFDLEKVDDVEDRPVQWYKKIEDLVHIELQNYRRPLKCEKCKGKKEFPTEHHEWYAVTEEVALRTVQRWRRFVQQEPWDENGILKGHWSKRIVFKI